MRISARLGVTEIVERDGQHSAELHAMNPPAAEEGAGDRIVTNVPLPEGAVVVSGGSVRRGAELSVQSVRWRSQGWISAVHRVVVLEGERFSMPVAASPWTPGPWAGEAILSRDFDPGLPSEANPA